MLQVNARAQFVVIVHELALDSGCRYTLTVTGGSCRPVLGIESISNNRVVFDWSTVAAIGYSLERSNDLAQPPPPVWLPVTTTPIVTDNATGSRNFYRLRKP